MNYPEPTGQSGPAAMPANRLCAAPPGKEAASAPAGRRQGPGQEVAAVPLRSLLRGYSPRLGGEDRTHVLRLAQLNAAFPPILVDRHSMQVIDGMHRLMAASLRGQETIDVEFFDGSPEDAFLRAVETNVRHGLPLSLADRRAAAVRIIASHPQMSDRAIGEAAGLAAKTVASLRRAAVGPEPQASARVGKDGRTRPLNGTQGRQRAAALLKEHPDASLREIARDAGISPATVRDVRMRIARGEEHAGPRPGKTATAAGTTARAPENTAQARQDAGLGQSQAASPALSTTLGKLLQDPSLRHNEHGRRLLRLLQVNAAGFQEWTGIAAAIPPHRLASICWMARHNARAWQGLAQELERRMQASSPLAAGKRSW